MILLYILTFRSTTNKPNRSWIPRIRNLINKHHLKHKNIEYNGQYYKGKDSPEQSWDEKSMVLVSSSFMRKTKKIRRWTVKQEMIDFHNVQDDWKPYLRNRLLDLYWGRQKEMFIEGPKNLPTSTYKAPNKLN